MVLLGAGSFAGSDALSHVENNLTFSEMRIKCGWLLSADQSRRRRRDERGLRSRRADCADNNNIHDKENLATVMTISRCSLATKISGITTRRRVERTAIWTLKKPFYRTLQCCCCYGVSLGEICRI